MFQILVVASLTSAFKIRLVSCFNIHKLTCLAVFNTNKYKQIYQKHFSIRKSWNFWKLVGGIFHLTDTFPTALRPWAIKWILIKLSILSLAREMLWDRFTFWFRCIDVVTLCIELFGNVTLESLNLTIVSLSIVSLTFSSLQLQVCSELFLCFVSSSNYLTMFCSHKGWTL